MDGWKLKGDAGQLHVREIHQLCAHRRFVEKGEPIRRRCLCHADAGLAGQLVEVGQAVFGEQLEHSQAAGAAKDFFRTREGRATAGRTAMIAGHHAKAFAWFGWELGCCQ